MLYGLWLSEGNGGAIGKTNASGSEPAPPVYMGRQHVFTMKGLPADACHSFILRARSATIANSSVDGEGWSAAGEPLRVSTRAAGVQPLSSLSSSLSQRRRGVRAAALAESTLDPCPLSGLAHPEYFGGSAAAVLFRGATSRISDVGTRISTVNCEYLAQCAPRYDGTRPFAAGRSERLDVASGLDWELGAAPALQRRLVSLPAGASVLSYVDPETGVRVALSLIGCRAEAVPAAAQSPASSPALLELRASRAKTRARAWTAAKARLHRTTAPATLHLPSGCFIVRCPSSSAVQHLFCVPGGGVPAATSASSWVADLNFAAHGLSPPSRYEVLSRTALAPRTEANARRPRGRGFLETPIYREAWILTFLSALVSARATPHLPLLLDVFRCSSLPPTLVGRPRSIEGISGALPPGQPGAAAVGAGGAVALAAAPGAAPQWGTLWTDTAQTDLARVLASFAPGALPGAWLRGLLFQLVWTLAVSRHAFGLRHGRLLSLAAVKLQQVPPRAPGARPYTCYRTTPEVLAGIALRVPARPKSPADSTSGSSGGGGGGGAPTFVSARSAQGAPEFLWEEDSSRADDDACYRADVAAKLARSSGGAPAATPAAERTSWCVSGVDVDGLRIKLHDFDGAVLVRKQLEWWTDGYAFPNTPWRDDLADLGLSLCPLAAGHVAGWAAFAGGSAADLCARMVAGEYATNPAAALRHALFSGNAGAAGGGLPTLDAVPVTDRELFSYVPVTVERMSPAAIAAGAAASAANARSGAGPVAGDGSGGIDGGGASHGSGEGTGVTASGGASGGGGGGGSGSNGSSELADADAADARREALDGLYPDDADVPRRVMLGMLTPARPWVVRRSSLAATLAWGAHQLPAWLAGQAPQRRPTMYNVFVNGVSVHSGPSRRFELSLLAPGLQTGCVRIAISAFYSTLGWTERSEPLQLNECPASETRSGEGEAEAAS